MLVLSYHVNIFFEPSTRVISMKTNISSYDLQHVHVNNISNTIYVVRFLAQTYTLNDIVFILL